MVRWLFIALLLPSLLRATAQYPERLRLEGQEEQMMATPLEDYWSAAHPKPAMLTQTSLSCWRGYIGTWEIQNDKLYLLRLERLEIWPKDASFEEHMIDLALFPLLGAKDPVLADWFSGVLRVPRGQILMQVNTGYASVYEQDLFLIVDHGKITQRRLVNNSAASLTSESDLAWREFGRLSPTGGVTAALPEESAEVESGSWLNLGELTARSKELAAAKTNFQVRGIYLPGKLWFPRQLGMEATYPLDIPATEQPPATGLAVEVSCTLTETDQGPRLVASEVSELPPGSAIQRKAPGLNEPKLSPAANLAADPFPTGQESRQP